MREYLKSNTGEFLPPKHPCTWSGKNFFLIFARNAPALQSHSAGRLRLKRTAVAMTSSHNIMGLMGACVTLAILLFLAPLRTDADAHAYRCEVAQLNKPFCGSLITTSASTTLVPSACPFQLMTSKASLIKLDQLMSSATVLEALNSCKCVQGSFSLNTQWMGSLGSSNLTDLHLPGTHDSSTWCKPKFGPCILPEVCAEMQYCCLTRCLITSDHTRTRSKLCDFSF